MKSLLLSLTLILSIFSLSSHARTISETTETIKISVADGELTCEWAEEYAHAGSIKFPKAFLKTKEIKGTKFKHTKFTGIGYVTGDFSCNPIEQLVANAGRDGKIKVKKTVKLYTTTYRDSRNGPITMIDTNEKVKLLLPTGTSVESYKMERQKF
jgi:hypothetical protein